ncbi:hypothetical protein [Nostoc sp.]|uniref:hypothetical protein n=1 Tax=Nostoc sp. TaxID=1180 RepID=UPI002FF34979
MMLVFEAKLEGANEQYGKLDEAIRTARFVRNSCVRYWLDVGFHFPTGRCSRSLVYGGVDTAYFS